MIDLYSDAVVMITDFSTLPLDKKFEINAALILG